MSEDGAPLSTRWLFEDFKRTYNSRFKMGNAASTETPVVVMNGARRERELAPYEKYQRTTTSPEIDASTGNGVVVVTEKKAWQKPLPEFPTLEMMALADSIMQDIVKGDLDVQWDSIKGLENAKRLLKEAVVMPIKYPQYFTGLLTPWKGILLFGPPGTGKVINSSIHVFYHAASLSHFCDFYACSGLGFWRV